MLNKAKPKRLKCKGYDLRSRILNLDTKYSGVGKALGKGIPVLSIFALLGIGVYSVLLFGSGFSSEEAYAETYTTTSGESSVSLTIGGSGEAEQVVAGRGNVTYRSHTVRVKADVVKDYGLTISGPANLTPPSGGTTISGVSNKTGTEMGSSTTYDNTWGYGWGATSTSDSNLTYRTLSTTGTNLLTVNSTSDKPALSNRAVDFTRKLVFAVKFGEEAIAGRYYANVTLSLTATPATLTTYSVTYDCKSGTGCPSNYSESLYDENKSYTIPSTAPTRSGYEFLGYSTTDGTTADADYAAGKTITLTQASPSRKLYAIWEAAGPSVTGFGGITQMQQMTTSICASVANKTAGQLYDSRDNSTYTVRKHEDGKCWMTQNLRLVNKIVTSADSDVTSDFTVPASSISGFTFNSDQSDVYYNNITDYGAYYSWKAATAGTGTKAISSGDAASSVCPRGWRLPSQSDYSGLATAIGAGNDADGSALFRNATYKFQLAGYVVDGSLIYTSSDGLYRSRTASSEYAYVLALDRNSADFLSASRVRGYSIRCVAYSS